MTRSAESPRSRAVGRMPVVFAGHGSPMNAIEDNPFSRGLGALAQNVPRPEAVLAVSAHWYVPGTYLTVQAQPKTIHDFGGFPPALYEVEYPAPGKADLAKHACSLLGESRAALSTEWGLDHGTWSVLKWMYPEADVPVVQLSLDRRLGAQAHYDLARSLKDLREQGILVLGSGNVVHNLRDAFQHMQSGSTETPDWARRFDATVERAVLQRDSRALIDLWERDGDGRSAHPTPDHWWPLIYALALTDDDDPVVFSNKGFELGSISMRSIVWG